MSSSDLKEVAVSLRFALLALLSSRPMTGYDLSKHFSQSVAHVWHAPDSQIYPELKRMERDGLLASVSVRWGPKGTKKQYQVTEVGLAAFRGWIDSPLEIRRQRDPAYLKAAYFEWADADAARSQLRQHHDYWSAHLALLEHTRVTLIDRTHPTLAHRLTQFPPEQHEQIVRYKVFAYDGLIDHARAEVAWADRGMLLVDQLETP